MMGSGTVLAVARELGHRATGVDLDPLAVLISRVWTRSIEPEAVTVRGALVLERARRDFESIGPGNAYPPHADRQTKEFLRYWFDDYARRQLAALALAIRRVQNPIERDVLWCAFSRLIITKQSGASLAMDLSHSRPHKSFRLAPTKPFAKFKDAVKVVVANAPHKGSGPIGPSATALWGDARSLLVKTGSIDLVLTSPPYLNAIDYMRCSKFSLVWMGHSLAELCQLRSISVGSEVSLSGEETTEMVTEVVREMRLRPALSGRDLAIFSRYVKDMDASVREVARVLAPGGRAIYVVGNSSVRGTFVRNSAVVEAVAERNGLQLAERRVRLLPPNRRYLPPPSSRHAGTTLSTRMRQEVVLAFEHTR
jgi:SAM-dependent methyltransferase